MTSRGRGEKFVTLRFDDRGDNLGEHVSCVARQKHDELNRGGEGPSLGLPFISKTKDDVNVERTKPLEGVEGSGKVVKDGDEDEGGAVVRVS